MNVILSQTQPLTNWCQFSFDPTEAELREKEAAASESQNEKHTRSTVQGGQTQGRWVGGVGTLGPMLLLSSNRSMPMSNVDTVLD